MKNLKAILIGCGDRGSVLGYAFAKIKRCSVAAVVDTDNQRAKTLAEKLGNPPVFDNYEKAIESVDAQVIIVASPTFLHAPMTLTGIRNNMHVYCEKPLVLSVEDGIRVIQEAYEKKRVLAVCHPMRYWPTYKKLIELVRDGKIGRPAMVRWHITNEVRPKILMHDRWANNGAILDMCCHCFDFMRYLFASEAVRVAGAGTIFAMDKESVKPVKILAIDTASLTVEYASGDIGSVSISWGLPKGVKGTNVFDVLGPKGILTIEGNYVCFTGENGDTKKIKTGKTDKGEAGIINFVESIRNNAKLLVSGKDGLESVRVATAALEAIESHSSVYIRR